MRTENLSPEQKESIINEVSDFIFETGGVESVKPTLDEIFEITMTKLSGEFGEDYAKKASEFYFLKKQILSLLESVEDTMKAKEVA
ncbi:hypothetical protein WJR50_33065 [Catalinimonas sp. 4WD22]|uniref:hypothetical protein n=1 Tax=Catalinimonas locisalis TaxID=3133978 RepID=UPI0031019D36